MKTMTMIASRVERVLFIACPVLMFVVMFGHTTGVVNCALVLIGLGTLAGVLAANRPSLVRWPLWLPIVAWMAWSLAASGWSVFPRVSLHAWYDEVLYPLITFWGFWLFGTRVQRPQWPAFAVWVACVLLVLISAICWGKLQPPTPMTFPMRYYNRVGHTSTLVIFAMTLFTGLLWRARWWPIAAVGLVLCAFVGLASLNRFFWAAAAVTLLVALYPLYRRHLVITVLAVVLLSAGTATTLEYSANLRYHDAPPSLTMRDILVAGYRIYVPKEFTALGDSLSSDTRPKLWAFYTAQGKHHAWLGIGFGKPLPGLAYAPEAPAELLAIEPQALTHAHNLFLNTWLQTGYIGVTLETLLFVSLIGCFWRLRASDPLLCAAGIALVLGMITKNLLDDFMWQTTMLAFWAFAGLLLGYGERRAGVPRAAVRGDGFA